MSSHPVIEYEVACQSGAGLGDGIIGFQVNIFVLDTLPQPLDEHVVHPAAAAVHADGNVVVLEHPGEIRASELAALVGVENFRRAVCRECLLQGGDTEVGGERVGQSPGEYLARIPIHDRHQVGKALRHRHVGHVRTPHLVRPINGESA